MRGPHERADLRVVARNINALRKARARFEEKKTKPQRVADAITTFAGSMTAAAAHAVFYGGWIVLNSGAVPVVRPWDPYPFVMLAMFASVEAIFLTTFVLITQNRMAALAERRADLDLQTNLLAEHELTKVIDVCIAIANKLEVDVPDREHVDALRHEVPPEQVLEQIERSEEMPQPPDSAPITSR